MTTAQPRGGRGARGTHTGDSRLWGRNAQFPSTVRIKAGTEGATGPLPGSPARDGAGPGAGSRGSRSRGGFCGAGGRRSGAAAGAQGSREQHIEMTTATPLGGNTIFSLNMTTRGEDFLYKSSGAIIAAVVVVVIIIFTVVLILLKMYNRKMRTRRELEPKGPKPASPSALGANSNSSQQPATVTFSPVDVHMETR
ncbi:hypothetical protein AB1E18_000922 [Capra hircus]